MSAAQEVNQSDFNKEVLEASKVKPILVDFWAPWCGPCRVQGPILDDLAAEIGGKATILKLNVDENIDLSGEYGVMSIPALMIFRNGQVVESLVGVQEKAKLMEMVEKHV